MAAFVFVASQSSDVAVLGAFSLLALFQMLFCFFPKFDLFLYILRNAGGWG
jgi:type III secretory pathway component EscR